MPPDELIIYSYVMDQLIITRLREVIYYLYTINNNYTNIYKYNSNPISIVAAITNNLNNYFTVLNAG